MSRSSSRSSRKTTSNATKYYFFDVTKLSYKEYFSLSNASPEERRKYLESTSRHEIKSEDALNVAKMTFWEEFCAAFILSFMPGVAITLPLIVSIFCYFYSYKYVLSIVGLILLPLTIIPQPFTPKILSSWIAFQILRYFSYKIAIDDDHLESIIKNEPCILVAPPHGFFPYGNILTMIVFPCIFGFNMRGIAASMALRVPFIKHLLCCVGVIDASRSVTHKALKNGHTVGINTGGVSEVFDTNYSKHEEIILLKERTGMTKLAINTGATMVPCYLFGNTLLYSMFTGGFDSAHCYLRNISRKIGFALCLFWGRFLLPIPYRIPIFGVMGHPIKLNKIDFDINSKNIDIKIKNLIDTTQEKLVQNEIDLFNTHKNSYLWNQKILTVQ